MGGPTGNPKQFTRYSRGMRSIASFVLIIALVLLTVGLAGTFILNRLQGQEQQNINKDLHKMTGFDRNIAKNAVYEWRDIRQFDDKELREQVSLLSKAGMHYIYLSLDPYVEIIDKPASKNRESEINAYHKAISNYIKLADKYKLKVYGLAGDKTWADPKLRYFSEEVLSFISKYNMTQPPETRIRGMVFDVESYNLATYSRDQKVILEEYLTYVEKVYRYQRTIMDEGGLEVPIGFSIPFWFENETRRVMQVSHNRKTTYPFQHLVDMTSKYNGFLVVMSYRNHLEGPDGVYEHSAFEVEYASKENRTTKIIVAQEVAEVEPEKITYHKKPLKQLIDSVNDIHKEYQAHRSYEGIAINDAASLLKKLQSNEE